MKKYKAQEAGQSSNIIMQVERSRYGCPAEFCPEANRLTGLHAREAALKLDCEMVADERDRYESLKETKRSKADSSHCGRSLTFFEKRVSGE